MVAARSGLRRRRTKDLQFSQSLVATIQADAGLLDVPFRGKTRRVQSCAFQSPLPNPNHERGETRKGELRKSSEWLKARNGGPLLPFQASLSLPKMSLNARFKCSGGEAGLESVPSKRPAPAQATRVQFGSW